ncbi:hypothetical protein TELCIR_05694, partial [Teladorsagia circumcincta]
MTPSGMPPHELKLKKGCIAMQLRNLDATKGFWNGTRFTVDECVNTVFAFLNLATNPSNCNNLHDAQTLWNSTLKCMVDKQRTRYTFHAFLTSLLAFKSFTPSHNTPICDSREDDCILFASTTVELQKKLKELQVEAE